MDIVKSLNIEVVMSWEEWVMYKKGELTLTEIKLGYKEKDLIKKVLVVSLAYFFIEQSKVFAYGPDGLNAIDTLGNKFLSIAQQITYWICIVMAIVDVAKEVLKGSNQASGIGKVLMKYVLAFTSIYLIPWLFDLIRESF